jgi:hypothetical protein
LPAAYTALQVDDIDLLNTPLTIPLYLDALANPKILLAEDSAPCAYNAKTGKIKLPIALHWVYQDIWWIFKIARMIIKANEIWGCSYELVIEHNDVHGAYDPTKNIDCMINIWSLPECPGEKAPDKYISGYYKNNGGEIKLVPGNPPDIFAKDTTLAHELGHHFCLEHNQADKKNIMYADNRGNPLKSCNRDDKAKAPQALQDEAKNGLKGKKSHAIERGVGKAAKDPVADVTSGYIDIDSYYCFSWGGKLCSRLTVASFNYTINSELGFYIESDNNVNTGTPGQGIDYFVGFNPALNQTIFRRYDADWVSLSPSQITAKVTNNWKDADLPPIGAGLDFEFPITLLTRRSGKIMSVQAVANYGTLWDYAPDSSLTSFLVAAQYAYSDTLAGICNMNGVGPENMYTYLNDYKPNSFDTPIRVGTVGAPSTLNPLYARNSTELAILNPIYQNLLSVNPYDLAIDQPWIAQDWELGTWINPKTGEPCTKITYWLRKDVIWVAPVTGEPLHPFTAHDLAFSVWYKYAFSDSRQWSSLIDLHHTKIIGDYCIEIFFNTSNTRALYWSGYQLPHLCKERVQDLLCAQEAESWSQHEMDERTLLHSVTQVDLVLLDGIPLTEGVDFIIRADDNTHSHNVFVPLRDLTGWINIVYWYPDIPASGFYLAGLPWTQTMYSIGPYYPVDIIPEMGGWAVLACNPYFFLETPPLGEVDWAWKWTGAISPRNGYYKIDIYDVVKVCGAYGSTGTVIPSQNWFPGADLATPCGKIDIFDVVTVTGKYGTQFGAPPP